MIYDDDLIFSRDGEDYDENDGSPASNLSRARFVQIFNESAIYLGKPGSSVKPEDCISKIHKHQEMLVQLSRKLEIDLFSHDSSNSISLLSQAIARLIESDFDVHYTNGDEIVGAIKKAAIKTKGIVYKEDSFETDDLIATAQICLFESSFKLSSDLKKMGANSEKIKDGIAWLGECCISIAADLSYNWNKDSAFSDHSYIFKSVLSSISNVCREEYVAKFKDFCKTYGNRDTTEQYLEAICQSLPGVLAEKGMGYNSDEFPSELVVDQIRDEAKKLIEDGFSLSVRAKSQTPSDFISRAWNLYTEEYLGMLKNKLEGMSKMEREDWRLGEGSKPMPLKPFLSSLFGDLFNQQPEDRTCNFPDYEKMNENVREIVSNIWGLSVAMLKVETQNA